jgi:hypothetical protein
VIFDEVIFGEVIRLVSACVLFCPCCQWSECDI